MNIPSEMGVAFQDVDGADSVCSQEAKSHQAQGEEEEGPRVAPGVLAGYTE